MKTTLSLGLTMRIGPYESLRLDVGHEIDTPADTPAARAAARAALYAELEPELRRMGAFVRAHGRPPTAQELATPPLYDGADEPEIEPEPQARTIPRDPEANWPGDFTRAAAQQEEDDWTGQRCSSCSAPIVWIVTAAKQRMPVLPIRTDGEEAKEGEVFDPRLHVSHFSDCPNADQHRRRRVESIHPWLKRIAHLRKEGTAADLAGLRHQLNTALPAERRNRAQGEALRRALTAAELAISLRCAPPEPPPAPPAPPELRIVREEAEAEDVFARGKIGNAKYDD